MINGPPIGKIAFPRTVLYSVPADIYMAIRPRIRISHAAKGIKDGLKTPRLTNAIIRTPTSAQSSSMDTIPLRKKLIGVRITNVIPKARKIQPVAVPDSTGTLNKEP